MSALIFKLYQHLPAPARSLAASARGYYLRSWRYGPETERLIEEAAERESWSRERILSWQEEQLAAVLHRAYRDVPFYRNQWEERRRRGDRRSPEYLENWPVLTKETLRRHPHGFLADDCNSNKMFCEQTSGTTGKPLRLWFSKRTLRSWFALFEARVRRWNGVSREEPWAILGGQQIVPASRTRRPFWVRNRPMNQLYLSANHISRTNIKAYFDALNQHFPTHLVAYSSSATVLASLALEQGLHAPSLKVVLTNAEPLLPWQREIIQKGLRCEVHETYGMAEITAAAGECGAGTLHTWPEVGWTEVLDETSDESASAGDCGRLISTGLLNRDMPLIRYETGDRVRGTDSETICSCNCKLPTFQSLEGRTSDLLITRDGRRVFWLNPVFYGLAIQEAQIVQEDLDELRVLYVPDSGFTSESAAILTERLRARVGNVRVMLKQVGEIARGPNGKFRPVICRVKECQR